MILTELLRGLAPFIAQDRAIGSVIAALLIWAAMSAYRLRRASRRLTRRFVAATELLERASDAQTFPALYEAISTELSGLDRIGASWRGYRQSLIVPAMPGRPIMATADARRWFDLPDLFRSAGADLRYHAALPGLLVGAGLLFTFLGLSAALSAAGAVVAEGVSQAQRNAALHDLLGAASAKFVTSLAGLLLSIVYALFRKRCLKQTEAALAGFLAALQERLAFRTPAFLQAEANALLERQYAEMQRIGTDFFVNLGSTLEREFGQGLQQHIGPLAAAIERLSAGLANQNENAMETMLSAFLNRLEGAVGDSMRATTTTLDTLGNRLDGLLAGLDGAARRMGQAAEEMAEKMGHGAESALGGIADQTRVLVESLRAAADEAGRSNRLAGDELAQRMADTAAGLAGAAEQFQARLEQGAANGVGRLGDPIQAMLADMRALGATQREAGDAAATVLRDSADEARIGLAETASTLAQSSVDLANRLAALGTTATAIEHTAKSVMAPLSDSAANLRSAAEAASRASGPLEAMARAATTSMESMTEASASMAGAHRQSEELAERLSMAAERFETIDKTLGATLRGLGEGLSDYQRTIAGFISGMDAGLARSVNSLSGIASSLEAAVDEMSNEQPQRRIAARNAG